MHRKYGESIGGKLTFVDPVLRWHDKEVPALLRYFYWIINAIWFAFKFKKHDVVVTEGMHITALVSKKIAAVIGKKVQVTALMDDEFLYFLVHGVYKGASEKYNRSFVKLYDYFFCIGDMEYDLCMQVIQDPKKMAKGFNGVSTERMEILLPIAPDLKSKNLIFIGNGTGEWRAYYKGLDLVLQVFNTIASAYSSTLLFVIGEWESEFIKQYIAQHCPDAGHRVQLVGKTNDLGKYLAASTLYLHPGRGEAWGISVNEAMAAGVIPIVSEWTGAAESVRKVDSHLVARLDVKEITQKVLACLALEEAGLNALSAKAKEVTGFYTEPAAIDQFKKIFFSWYGNSKHNDHS